MKKKILSFIAAASVCAALAGFECSALNINEYSVNEDNITVYLSDVSDENMTASVGGEKAEVHNLGSIYDSDRIETVFLIDSSSSMKEYSEVIKDFLHGSIESKPDNEYYSIGLFAAGKTPKYLINDVNDRYDLDKTVDDLTFSDKASYIYDNLSGALSSLSSDGQDCYKRIVLFTDGVENSAKGITIDELRSDVEQMTVQIYTVTFVNSKKSNYESLKQVASLARLTGGTDIQLDSGSDGKKESGILNDSLRDIHAIKVFQPASKSDRGIYPVEVISGGESAIADIRMPGKSSVTEPVVDIVTEPETVSETKPVTTMLLPETEPPVPEKKKASPKKIAVFVLIGIAAAGIITAVLMIILSKKNDKVSGSAVDISGGTEPLMPSDGLVDKTEILGSPDSIGATEILLSSSPSATTIILRDVANPAYTFETSLRSGDEIIIGRDPAKCSKVIDYDRSISGRHCRISCSSDRRVMIEDLKSSNHTYVNDKEVFAPVPLNTGDEIRLGRVKLSVTIK